ncbi:acyltransferase family protein [Sphingomonas montana]|uniref:acyltransferase family protein n=1 Tax=Sphingomonas montana TaxID=1843236 RepID=UPI00096F7851|nr:acyltransferase family protein [Sphingomonas montana]
MKFRQDIEGLRALAVVPIVMFHAGISRLAGGFVGVDIFFVISGFLITTIITRELAAGQFSIATFYQRRITRIFPALFVLLLVTLAVGCATMLPGELAALGGSALAATGFVSNIFFWFETDYFDAAADAKPLLHTWSLAVEEQFYILYPLLLIFVARHMAGRLRQILWGVVALSFVIGAVMVTRSPAAAFYLLPARTWELALGGLVAAGGFPTIARPRIRGVMAAIGLALVLIGLVAIRESMAFPVPWAVLPCLGAALMIAYGQDSMVGRLLSVAPARWIGRISYSLYLWHWPIITFYRLETGFALGRGESIFLIALSVGAAFASYFLVERPVLDRFRHGATRPILLVGTAGLAAMLAAALVVTLMSDRWRSWPPAALQMAGYADYRDRPEYPYQFRRGECFRGEGEPFRPERCLALSADRPNVVVLGDSHAAQYWRAIALRYPSLNVMQANASGCRPTLGGRGAARCREVMDYVLGPLLATRRVSTVVLAGRWTATDLSVLGATIAHIRASGARPIVIGPTVEYDAIFPLLLARQIARGTPQAIHRNRQADRVALDARMARSVPAAGGDYISVYRILCPAKRCRLTTPSGAPMQFDYGHLTLAAARWVVDRMPLSMPSVTVAPHRPERTAWHAAFAPRKAVIGRRS